MEEITAEAEPEEDNTKDGSRCPYCSVKYAELNPKKCAHLLCEVYYAESNNEFIAAPNSSIVANLFGIEVPRVIAMRFIRLLREKRPPDIGHSNGALATIKYSTETIEEFFEWTYFLVDHPDIYMTAFLDFVRRTYCDPGTPTYRIPFSQLQFANDVVVFNSDTPENHLSWIMISGLPDSLPVFLYPMKMDDRVLYVGRTDDLGKRIETWSSTPDTCVVNHLATLPTYLVN